MTIYRRDWHDVPRTRANSARLRCRVCDRLFAAGHVPSGDLICRDCAREVTTGHVAGLFDVPSTAGGDSDRV